MARDIEEFLRRAAERRKQQLKQKPVAQPPAPAAQPPRVKQPPRRLVISDDAVEVVREKRREKRDMRSESVAQHVSRHLDSTGVTEHSTHLAETLEQTDERLQEHLHEKFDHSVGTLNRKSTVQDDATPFVEGVEISHLASELIEMLRSPKSVRKAIIIAEVLKRPNFE